MVRILSGSVVQAKKAAVKGTLCHQNILPRETGTLMRYKDVIERPYIKHPSLGKDSA
jgi:hypothetical protein